MIKVVIIFSFCARITHAVLSGHYLKSTMDESVVSSRAIYSEFTRESLSSRENCRLFKEVHER